MATFSEKMVEKIEELLKSAVGLSEVSFDGQTVKYVDLISQYEYWKRQVAIESGTRPIVSRITMSGGV